MALKTKEEIFNKIKEDLVALFELDEDDICMESRIFEDLDLDSIDAVDLIVKIQKEIGKRISLEDFKQVRTIGDVVEVLYRISNS